MKNIKHKFNGAPSDHAALYIKVKLPNSSLLSKKRKNKALPKKVESIITHSAPQDPQPVSRKYQNSSKTSPKEN